MSMSYPWSETENGHRNGYIKQKKLGYCNHLYQRGYVTGSTVFVCYLHYCTAQEDAQLMLQQRPYDVKIQFQKTFNGHGTSRSTSPWPAPSSSNTVVGKPSSVILEATCCGNICPGSYCTSALAAINATRILCTPEKVYIHIYSSFLHDKQKHLQHHSHKNALFKIRYLSQNIWTCDPPFTFLACFSIAATQEAQVMPVIRRKHFSKLFSSPSKAAFSCQELVVLLLWGDDFNNGAENRSSNVF